MLINHGKEGKTTRKSKLENNVKLKNAVQEKRIRKFYTYICSSLWKKKRQLRKERASCEKSFSRDEEKRQKIRKTMKNSRNMPRKVLSYPQFQQSHAY